MVANVRLTEDDVGKQVFGGGGEDIGRVVEVRDGRAYVDPDPNTAEAVMSELGWGDSDQGTYALHPSSIKSVTDDEIRLESS